MNTVTSRNGLVRWNGTVKIKEGWIKKEEERIKSV